MPHINLTPRHGVEVGLHYNIATPSCHSSLKIVPALPCILFFHAEYLSQEMFEGASARKGFSFYLIVNILRGAFFFSKPSSPTLNSETTLTSWQSTSVRTVTPRVLWIKTTIPQEPQQMMLSNSLCVKCPIIWHRSYHVTYSSKRWISPLFIFLRYPSAAILLLNSHKPIRNSFYR